MYKSFLILVFLVSFGSYSDHVVGQATSTKTQPLTNIKNPKNPISSSSIVIPVSTERAAAAKRLYKEGMKLAEAGQFSQAVQDFQQALRLDPEYADAYAALGHAYFKMREWQKAVDNFRRAAELNAKQREAQGKLHQKLSMQQRVGASTPAKAAPTSPQTILPQENKAIAAGVKAVSPKSDTTRQPQQREETSTPVKARPVSPQIKLPHETNASAAGMKTLGPESETTRQPQQREGASTPTKAAPTSPQTILPQENKAIAAGVKVVSPKSETTRQPHQLEEAGARVKSAPSRPETKLQQPANPNASGVKPVRAESETTRQPEETAASFHPLKSDDGNALEQIRESVGVRVAKSVTPASTPAETKSISPISTSASSYEVSLTKIYRVGPSDVLDIRLNNSQSTQSTLFTVTPSGLLEHPMLTEPLPVTGFTAEEIGTKIENDLKKRALIDDPKVVVGVRDYASHTILVSGLVKDSGTKFLRREAIPLYVVVADAQPLPEAATVTLVRNELNQIYEIDLRETADMNLLVRPGDVITLHPNVTRFVYIGGEVKFPGEKTYRRGLTLMQAMIAAGGVTPKSKVAEIARDDGRGFLIGTRFNLKDIVSGKTGDPLLRPGDRIMILR